MSKSLRSAAKRALIELEDMEGIHPYSAGRKIEAARQLRAALEAPESTTPGFHALATVVRRAERLAEIAKYFPPAREEALSIQRACDSALRVAGFRKPRSEI